MSDATLAATALRLIKKRGKIGQVKTVTTTFAPNKPGTPIQTTSLEDVHMVTVPVEQKYLKGDILITDKQAFIAASGVTELHAKDRIILGGVTHKIVGLETIEPGNTTILYIAFLRK